MLASELLIAVEPLAGGGIGTDGVDPAAVPPTRIASVAAAGPALDVDVAVDDGTVRLRLPVHPLLVVGGCAGVRHLWRLLAG
jgi:hypothetical protein